MRGIALNLCAQTTDVHHQRVFVADVWSIPERFTEGVDSDDVAAVVPELAQQGVFLGGQRNFLAVPAHKALAPVNLHIAETGAVVFRRIAINAAQHSGQSQQQLLRQEGFGDVIVGAETESLQPRSVFVAGREKERRHIAQGAQLTEQAEAVAVGQHHVEKHSVWLLGAEDRQRFGTAAGSRRRVACLGEKGADHFAEGALVVDDENFVSHGGSFPSL